MFLSAHEVIAALERRPVRDLIGPALEGSEQTIEVVNPATWVPCARAPRADRGQRVGVEAAARR